MYVDPTSLKHLELGTLEFPYKSIYHPLVELFNYLPVQDKSYTVKILAGTTANL